MAQPCGWAYMLIVHKCKISHQFGSYSDIKLDIFNPVAISIVILSLFGSGVGIWWVATPWLLAPVAILGFLISVYWVYPQSVNYGVAFMLIFAVMFIASLVSMTKAPVAGV